MKSSGSVKIKQNQGDDAAVNATSHVESPFGFRGSMVMRWLNNQFTQGKLAVGSQLPSYRDIATQTDVSVGTVQQVMASLEERGVVRRRPRRSCVLVNLPGDFTNCVKTLSVALIKAVPAKGFAAVPDAWTDAIFRSVESHLHQSRIQVLSVPVDPESPHMIEELTAQLAASRRSLIGAAIKSLPGVENVIEKIESLDLPWITLNPLSHRHPHNFVAAANSQGTAAVAYAWAKQGLRLLASIGPAPHEAVSAREKILGLYEGFIDADVPTDGIESVHTKGITQDDGREAVQGLLDRPHDQRPQAIFAAGDFLAAGALSAALDHGLTVPENLSIVGSTGLPEVSMLRPSLTVLAQPMQEMGRQAAAMLLNMHHEGFRKMAGRRVPCRLLGRESSRLEIAADTITARYNVDVQSIPQAYEPREDRRFHEAK